MKIIHKDTPLQSSFKLYRGERHREYSYVHVQNYIGMKRNFSRCLNKSGSVVSFIKVTRLLTYCKTFLRLNSTPLVCIHPSLWFLNNNAGVTTRLTSFGISLQGALALNPVAATATSSENVPACQCSEDYTRCSNKIRFLEIPFKGITIFFRKNVYSFLIANEGSFEYIVIIFLSLVTYVAELILNEEPKLSQKKEISYGSLKMDQDLNARQSSKGPLSEGSR